MCWQVICLTCNILGFNIVFSSSLSSKSIFPPNVGDAEDSCRPYIAGLAEQSGYVAPSCAHFTERQEPKHQVLCLAGQFCCITIYKTAFSVCLTRLPSDALTVIALGQQGLSRAVIGISKLPKIECLYVDMARIIIKFTTWEHVSVLHEGRHLSKVYRTFIPSNLAAYLFSLLMV